MRLRVKYPVNMHVIFNRDTRDFEIESGDHVVDTVSLDEISEHLERDEPLLIDNINFAPFSISAATLGALLDRATDEPDAIHDMPIDLPVVWPDCVHTHWHSDTRDIQLVDEGHQIAWIGIDDIRAHAERREPLVVYSDAYAPITISVSGLDLLLACSEITTECGDKLAIDGTRLLRNGLHIATIPQHIHNARLCMIKTFRHAAPGRFVSIIGGGGAYLFDLATHNVLIADMPADTAQRAAGGAA